MKPQSTYFLYGYYGAGNFGDDILLRSAIENILARDAKARFLIRNHGPVDFLSEFGDRITLTGIEDINRRPVSTARKFLLFIQAYWFWMGRASHLMVGGGTLIHDRPYLKSTILLLCLAVIARLRRRKIYGIGLGVKRINSRPGKITVALLVKCFHRLCLRDQDSFGRCLTLAPRAKNMLLTSDLAYALEWKNVAVGDAIAITLVDYMFDDGRNAGLLENLAEALSAYIAKGRQVRFIVLQKRSYDGGGDEGVLQQVMEKIPSAQRCSCSMLFLEPTQDSIEKAFDGVGLMLGMRFHALVFAAMNFIPFAGLAHEPKIDAMANEFAMPFLPLRQVDTAALVTMMGHAMNSAINQQQIAANTAKARSNFNFDVVQ